MHSVLVVINKPDAFSPAQQQTWSKIQSKIAEQLNLYKDVKKINESILQISLENALPAFVNILRTVQDEKFPYQVLFSEQDLHWVVQFPK